jgi:hypothetical protein
VRIFDPRLNTPTYLDGSHRLWLDVKKERGPRPSFFIAPGAQAHRSSPLELNETAPRRFGINTRAAVHLASSSLLVTRHAARTRTLKEARRCIKLSPTKARWPKRNLRMWGSKHSLFARKAPRLRTDRRRSPPVRCNSILSFHLALF